MLYRNNAQSRVLEEALIKVACLTESTVACDSSSVRKSECFELPAFNE